MPANLPCAPPQGRRAVFSPWLPGEQFERRVYSALTDVVEVKMTERGNAMRGKFHPAHPVLPKELVDRQSDLGKLIVFAGDLSVIDPIRSPTVVKTQDLLRRACRNYRPSTGEDDLLCRSGEETGHPYRGRACAQCTVGQFSETMFFVGSLTSTD
jgi:hypothetical protein